jgi:AcrR family transcriptional regulator
MSESTRDRILEAAAEYFADESYRDARMTAIASRAEIARATLYKHFKTKESVLLALNDKVIDDARLQLDILKDDSISSYTQRIAQWFEQGLTSQWRLHAIRVVVIEETQQTLLSDRGATSDIVKEVERALIRTLKSGIVAGEIAAHLSPAKTTRAIQATLLGLQRNNVSARPLLTVTSKAQLKAVVDLILEGIKAH